MEELEFRNKPVFDVEVKVQITEEDIDNVICCMLESDAISYWGILDIRKSELWKKRPKNTPVSVWATHLILTGEVLKIIDICDFQDGIAEEEIEKWELTKEKLKEGIQKELIKHPENLDPDNWDGDSVDRIIQYALFGEITYC